MPQFSRDTWTTLTVAIVIAFFAGLLIGRAHPPAIDQVAGLSNMTSTSTANVDFDAFWKAWNILSTDYVPTHSTTTPSAQDKVYGAIEGLAASYGDPYTVFFPPVQNKSFSDQVSGSFEGVGMEVDIKNGALTVIAPLKGTPADLAGIKTDDVILTINGVSTDGLTVDDAINKIKGPAGTKVTFTIARAGTSNPLTIVVTRDVITIPEVTTKSVGDVFDISLAEFSANSPDLFRTALREFVQSGDNKLVIDLRGNPGGYLEAAVDMASWFLPSGDLVVSEKASTAANSEDYQSLGYNIFNNNLKLAILIDSGSASASEIFSGALHDHGVAVLVGQKSYGKGSVQELVPITADTSLKVTIAKWYTPSGLSISGNGISPDVPVVLDVTKYQTKGDDSQLDKAVEILDSPTEYAQAQAGDFATSTTATSTSSQ